MHPYFSLQGRTALVTGGTRGIGKMIAKAFVEAGAHVYVCSRDVEACQQTAEELGALGSCHGVAANLATEEGVRELAARLGEQITHLDILVNNAGTTWGAPLESYPVKGWEKVMQLNVTSVFSCIQQFLPLLRKAGSAANPARIINIGSVAGISSFGEQAYAYGPSKAALHQLSRILARELVNQHINVNVIAPGRFPSKMTQHIGNDEQALAEDTALIPMKRWGREEEMAALAISLASTAGAYMTGNIIPLDGGFSL
ncbi:SDR family oxidoreductase [Pseudomonas atacamensis]|jgi:NAD(P)-dependent dehydrogenase (short-subunit alcohol dehydrogenase family)|uniref:3-oxoacyl-ACP reductase n=2 Tax=Pseudomonas TaxID=286 RepID=V8RB14_9PSED|nr:MULTISPECIES: SDR family oxidoreductase [Pseudomonas]ETF08474.1 3-oxoacyl-ACP reductase [Pseudomonas moraviensis R28-S]MCW0920114.1 SDR family oxidoreductase [Pseudomonas sp. RG1]QXH74258.1 SDR family oxidoreductase [Pseudomonas atacamensis]THF36340.1 SDR family oxidoreductase [Pseudomonas atacamensis]GLH18591.1 rhamnolipids biosynthesis 3-oxoacyl-[acyl-carrier-protein] reductase [Pseudomonas atacamensis]